MGSFKVFENPQRQRLKESIEVERRGHPRADEKTEAAIVELLEEASSALNDRQIDEGWALVHRAQELRVRDYDDAEILASARSLREELTSTKFSGWRREAILRQVGKPSDEEQWGRRPSKERRAAVMEAMRIAHDSYLNEYFDLALLRRYQAVLLTIAAPILTVAIIGAYFLNADLWGGVGEAWVAPAAALTGALGGIASALQRVTRRSPMRIPQRIGSLVASLSRPLIGAIAGLTVYLGARAGVIALSDGGQQVAYLLLIAFGSGFTERLVVHQPADAESPKAAAGSSAAERTDEESRRGVVRVRAQLTVPQPSDDPNGVTGLTGYDGPLGEREDTASTTDEAGHRALTT